MRYLVDKVTIYQVEANSPEEAKTFVEKYEEGECVNVRVIDQDCLIVMQ